MREISLSLGVSKTDTFSSVYPVLNNAILDCGKKTNSRNGSVCEVLDFKTQITNPYRRCVGGCGRDINIFFLLAEAMWIACGRSDVEFLTIFNQRMKEFSDDGVVFHAPYGYRLRHYGLRTEDEEKRTSGNNGIDQVIDAIRLLSANRDSRQVVMSIWNPDMDLGYITKDIPCNDMVMFKIRDGKLITTIQNRSNDLHWGLPTNVFQFSFLTELMAASLGITLGTQTHNSQSLHIYEWSDVANKMNDCYKSGKTFDLYGNEVGGHSERIDFNFTHEIPVNRFREIESVLRLIIDNLYIVYRGGNANKDSLNCIKEFSRYLFLVYRLLAIYIYYKKNLIDSDNKDNLRLSCMAMIDSLDVDPKLDIVLLSKNFFAKRVMNYEVKFDSQYIGRL
jgi:thymidylate synthase